MSKRAADKMWNRAAQVHRILRNLNRIMELDGTISDLTRYSLTLELRHLYTVWEAMVTDGDAEYEHGQEWYREQERKAKVRREQERIRPTGPKVEEAL